MEQGLSELPDDVESLRAIIAAQAEELARQSQRLRSRDTLIEKLKAQLAVLKRVAIIFLSIGNRRFMHGKASISPVRPWPIGSARRVRCSSRSSPNCARTCSPAAVCMATTHRCWSLARARRRRGDCGATFATVALGETRRHPASPTSTVRIAG